MPLTKKEIQEVMVVVNQYWPDYSIPQQIMKKPTSNFVIEFYSKVVAEIESQISFITGGKTDCLQSLEADLDLEIKLYRNLMRLVPTLKDVDFKLGDILCPTPVRTNKFMLLCMHYLVFTYEATKPTQAIVQESIAKQTKIEKTEEKNQELLVKIAAASEKLGMELEDLQKVKNEHKKVKEEWEAKREKYMKMKEKSGSLQKRFEDKQSTLKKLQKTVKQLKEQVVTEEEQQHLEQTKSSLLSELEVLKSTNVEIGDGFHQQRETINHFENCLRLLKNLHMTSNIGTGHKIEQQLMNEEQELQNIKKELEQQRKKKNTLQGMKIKLNKNTKMLNKEIEKLAAELDEAVRTLESLSKNLTKEYNELQKYEKSIAGLKNDTLKYQAGLEKVQKAFKDKYESMKAEREQTVALFTDRLSKLKETLNQ